MGRLHGQGGGQQSLQRGVRIGAFASDAAPELRTLPRHPAALGQEKVEEASRERPVCFRDWAGVRILRDGSVCRGRALRRGFRPDMPEVGGRCGRRTGCGGLFSPRRTAFPASKHGVRGAADKEFFQSPSWAQTRPSCVSMMRASSYSGVWSLTALLTAPPVAVPSVKSLSVRVA